MAEAFTEVSQEFRQEDKVQFTRNNKGAGHINGRTANTVALAALGARDSAHVGALNETLKRYGPEAVLDGPGPVIG